MKKKPAHKDPKGYQGSKFDNDKGVREGSAADMKRDAKGVPAFLKAKKKGGK